LDHDRHPSYQEEITHWKSIVEGRTQVPNVFRKQEYRKIEIEPWSHGIVRRHRRLTAAQCP
jgi:hypothetical protein